MKKSLLYKKKIEGFEDVEETVKVVEKAAASHIHLLKKQVSALLNYKNEIEMQLARLLEFGKFKNHPLLKKRKGGERTLLVVAGNKGIVGGLYHDLVNQFLQRKRHYQKIFVLGSKAKEYLEEEKVRCEQLFYTDTTDLPEPKEVEKISVELFSRFKNDNLRSIDILYHKFISLAEQRPTFKQFLPFDFLNKPLSYALGGQTKIYGKSEGWVIFEPSKKEVFDYLLKRYIDVSFIEVILEAKLSEFSARTTTAEHAVSKTKEFIQSLRIAFLKERRSSITRKQLASFITHKLV